ncbi:hypothetical protein TNCV_4586831 [Trichonephila clavipes]|nr:hypothetical protein TNCV_4586831 [Trichonephila clavipes]
MVHGCSTIDPDYTSSCHTRSTLATCGTAWSAVPHEHIQNLFESIPRCVAAVNSNNGGYSGYRFWQKPHFTEVYKLNHLILGQQCI